MLGPGDTAQSGGRDGQRGDGASKGCDGGTPAVKGVKELVGLGRKSSHRSCHLN